MQTFLIIRNIVVSYVILMVGVVRLENDKIQYGTHKEDKEYNIFSVILDK